MGTVGPTREKQALAGDVPTVIRLGVREILQNGDRAERLRWQRRG